MYVKVVVLLSLVISALADGPKGVTLNRNRRELKSNKGYCNQVVNAIAPNGFTCSCSFSFITFGIDYTCSGSKACYFDKGLCGKSTVQGVISATKSITTSSCLAVDKSSNPTLPSEMCITTSHCQGKAGQLCECSASIDGSACNSCTVCSSGRTIQLNCTNHYDWFSSPCVPAF